MTHLSGTDVRRESQEYGVPNGHGFNSAVLIISPSVSDMSSFQKLSWILVSGDRHLDVMTHLSGTDVRRVSKEYGVPNGHGFNSAVLTISPNISDTLSFQKLPRILMSIDKHHLKKQF